VLPRLLRRPTTEGWLAASSAGFAVAGLAVAFLGDDASPQSRAVTGTPQFKVWAVLVIALLAALPVIWHVGMSLLSRLGVSGHRLLLRTLAGPALLAAAGILTLLALLAGVLLFDQNAAGSQRPPLAYGAVRFTIIYLLAFGAAIPACTAMWTCYRQAGQAGIPELLRLRECLLTALTALGALLSLGVFVTGALRQADLAVPRLATAFPASYVLIFGFAFSALLLANFAPAYHRVTAACKDTLDTLLPVLVPPAENWRDRLQERGDLADLLKLTSGTRDVVTSAIVVVGPFLSSAFSLFLPTGAG
jgi:hypothetical protein